MCVAAAEVAALSLVLNQFEAHKLLVGDVLMVCVTRLLRL